MIFSPQSKGKKLTSYHKVRDALLHYIQERYGQGGQYVTKSLKNMKTVDLNAEDPTRKISIKKMIR